jgi:hypothetical protein
VNEVAQHLAEDLTCLRREPGLEMEVVDDDDEDAAGGVAARPVCRQNQAVAARRRGDSTLYSRPPWIIVNETISCLTPSS